MLPGRSFAGTVAAIGAGAGSAFSLLPPENASGNWVKVTQRVPVRILLDDLDATVIPSNQAEVRKYQARLHRQIEQSFRRTDLREEAEEIDRQGLGLTRRGEPPA